MEGNEDQPSSLVGSRVGANVRETGRLIRLTLGNADSCLGVIKSGTRVMLEVANDRDCRAVNVEVDLKDWVSMFKD